MSLCEDGLRGSDLMDKKTYQILGASLSAATICIPMGKRPCSVRQLFKGDQHLNDVWRCEPLEELDADYDYRANTSDGDFATP